MNELRTQNYPNTIGALEEAVNKWGSMEVMNKVPFVLAFSWTWYNFDPQVTYDALKKFPWKGMLLMMMRFMSNTWDVDLLNDTILEVCKSLENKWSQFKWISSEAQKLYNNIRVPSEHWEVYKINQAADFYDKYGEAITNAMYMLNTWARDDKSWESWNRSINKMILLEKSNNKTFQRYHKKLHDFVESDDTTFMEKDLMKDAFDRVWVSGLNVNKATRSLIEYTSANTFRTWDMWKFMWEEIEAELRAIPKDASLSQEQKEFLIKDLLRWFLSWIIAKWIHEKTLKQINWPTSPMARLGVWWMELFDDFNDNGLNEAAILDKNNSAINTLLDRYTKNIINVESWGANFSKQLDNKLTIWDIIWDVKDDTQNSIKSKKKSIIDDDDDYDDY